MAAVHVNIKKKSGADLGFTLDDELDAERIAYLKKGVAREDFESVEVKKVPAKKAAASTPAKPEPQDPGHDDKGDDNATPKGKS